MLRGGGLIDSIYRDYHAARGGGLIDSIYRDYHAAGEGGSLTVSTGIIPCCGGSH